MSRRREQRPPAIEVANYNQARYTQRAKDLFEIKWICQHKGMFCTY